ncbi:MAG: hypothetical protein WHS89_12415 [Acidimicrobiales bacterium]
MTESALIPLAGAAIATVAAVRGTWSPCGQSMLSSINPLTELGRGHRYARTAGFFVAGALVGGALVGAVAAMLAAGVAAVDLSDRQRAALLALAALSGAVVDAGHLRWRTPFLRRQVNEDWLAGFRPWVYGAGFGFQIGTGVMTYVMTTGVFVAVLAAVLSASVRQAVLIMAVFGAVRGSAILLSARVRCFEDLQRLHRRFEAWREPTRRLTIASLGVSGALLTAAASGSAALALPLAIGAVALALTARPADVGTDPGASIRSASSRAATPALS